MAQKKVKLLNRETNEVEADLLSCVYRQTHLMARAFGRLYLQNTDNQVATFIYNNWSTIGPYIRICPFRAAVLVNHILALGNTSEVRVAEFGVSSGGTFALMCLAAQTFGVDAKFMGYDTFQGLPRPHEIHDTAYKEGQFAATRKEVEDLLRSIKICPSRYELIEGDIRAEGRLSAEISFDIAYLDMDLYEPTLFAVKHLKRCSPDAILILDDVFDDSGGVLVAAEKERLDLQAGPTGQAIVTRENILTSDHWEPYLRFLQDCRTAINPGERGSIDYLISALSPSSLV